MRIIRLAFLSSVLASVMTFGPATAGSQDRSLSSGSSSGVYSPTCSDVASLLKSRTWEGGSGRYVEFTNTGDTSLAVYIIYNTSQRNVFTGLNNELKPRERFKFSQSVNRPAAYRIVAVDAKYFTDLFVTGVKTECAKSTEKLAAKLHKELCDEIGGSKSCYPQER